MKLRTGMILSFAALLTFGMTAAVADHCHQEGHEGHAHAAGEHGQQPPEMDPQAMMAMMQEMGTPGEHHQHLAHAVGTWKAAIKMWQGPGQEPMLSEGKAMTEPVLGGRYFRTDFEGSFMGMPFKGVGMDGYDKATKKHVGTWMDDMSTMIYHYTGECSDGGKVTTTWGEVFDPMTGQMMKQKNVMTVIDQDTSRFDMYMVLPDGSEFKNLEITYTRQ